MVAQLRRREGTSMYTKITRFLIALLLIFPTLALAGEGQKIFHAFKLETDIGSNGEKAVYSWDFDGWIGGDINKMHLKSEGEKVDGQTVERAEYWAMYSRNVATFWDVQVGIRFDEQPESTGYLVAGFEGLAPYFFETEAHLFLSDEGDVTARLHQSNEFLLTQRLITEPYLEVNFSAQDVPELEIGSGIISGEFGIQTRYEITRKFAPYVDFKYERKFGETSTIARKHGENRDDFIMSMGLRLMF